jgi:hypothetical protein
MNSRGATSGEVNIDTPALEKPHGAHAQARMTPERVLYMAAVQGARIAGLQMPKMLNGTIGKRHRARKVCFRFDVA